MMLGVRIGVCSDVHGRHDRLLAVLGAMAAAGVDERWCLGDLIGGEPVTAELVGAGSSTRPPDRRNHDAWALGPDRLVARGRGLHVVERNCRSNADRTGRRSSDAAPGGSGASSPAGRAEAHPSRRSVEVLDFAACVEPGSAVRRPAGRRVVAPPVPLRGSVWKWTDEFLDLVERHLDVAVVDRAEVAEQCVVLGHRSHPVYRAGAALPTRPTTVERGSVRVTPPR